MQEGSGEPRGPGRTAAGALRPEQLFRLGRCLFTMVVFSVITLVNWLPLLGSSVFFPHLQGLAKTRV